jgi:hypothetical protein
MPLIFSAPPLSGFPCYGSLEARRRVQFFFSLVRFSAAIGFGLGFSPSAPQSFAFSSEECPLRRRQLLLISASCSHLPPAAETPCAFFFTLRRRCLAFPASTAAGVGSCFSAPPGSFGEGCARVSVCRRPPFPSVPKPAGFRFGLSTLLHHRRVELLSSSRQFR